MLVFVAQLAAPNEGKTPPTHVPSRSRAFSCVFSAARTNFWLVVVSPHPLEAIENQGPVALSFLFLRRSIRPPQMMGKRPPLHVPPCRIASPTSHPPPKSSFGWLLRSFIEWQPPKTDAPSISQFFAACHLGHSNQGIPPQQARARAPGACNRLIEVSSAAIWAHGGWFHGEGGRSRGG